MESILSKSGSKLISTVRGREGGRDTRDIYMLHCMISEVTQNITARHGSFSSTRKMSWAKTFQNRTNAVAVGHSSQEADSLTLDICLPSSPNPAPQFHPQLYSRPLATSFPSLSPFSADSPDLFIQSPSQLSLYLSPQLQQTSPVITPAKPSREASNPGKHAG